MKKAEAEKMIINRIKEVGLKGYCSIQGEGRQRNNEYYRFSLKNGEQRYLTNPSDTFKSELGIN